MAAVGGWSFCWGKKVCAFLKSISLVGSIKGLKTQHELGDNLSISCSALAIFIQCQYCVGCWRRSFANTCVQHLMFGALLYSAYIVHIRYIVQFKKSLFFRVMWKVVFRVWMESWMGFRINLTVIFLLNASKWRQPWKLTRIRCVCAIFYWLLMSLSNLCVSVCRTQYACSKPCVCACFGAMFNDIQRNRAKVVAVKKQKTVPNKTNTKKGMYFHCCHRNSIICRMGPGKGWSQTEKRTCGSEKKGSKNSSTTNK